MVAHAGEFLPAREVILAAGTPMTPALLLRSGLGPEDELRRVGLSAIVDVPGVGRGLYDQPGAVIPALPVPGAVPGDWPVTQVIGRLAAISDEPADQGLYVCLFSGPPPGGTEPMSAIMIGDFNPRSRGTITLASADPNRPPQVDLGFYQAGRDLRRMRSAYRHAWSIAQHPAFTQTVSMVDDQVVADDERLDSLLRAVTFSRLTLLGGAAMGADHDRDAVVDEHCRVRGVDGLRVVDLSIVPVPLRAPTALEAMMLGERTAGWIASGTPDSTSTAVGLVQARRSRRAAAACRPLPQPDRRTGKRDRLA